MTGCRPPSSEKAIDDLQCDARYPIVININLFSFFARSTASSSKSCHDTRVSACARTKGLWLSPARFRRDAAVVDAAVVVVVVLVVVVVAAACDDDDALAAGPLEEEDVDVVVVVSDVGAGVGTGTVGFVAWAPACDTGVDDDDVVGLLWFPAASDCCNCADIIFFLYFFGVFWFG